MCVPIKKIHIDQVLNDAFGVSERGGVRNIDNYGEGVICDAVIFFEKNCITGLRLLRRQGFKIAVKIVGIYSGYFKLIIA